MNIDKTSSEIVLIQVHAASSLYTEEGTALMVDFEKSKQALEAAASQPDSYFSALAFRQIKRYFINDVGHIT